MVVVTCGSGAVWRQVLHRHGLGHIPVIAATDEGVMLGLGAQRGVQSKKRVMPGTGSLGPEAQPVKGDKGIGSGGAARLKAKTIGAGGGYVVDGKVNDRFNAGAPNLKIWATLEKKDDTPK